MYKLIKRKLGGQQKKFRQHNVRLTTPLQKYFKLITIVPYKNVLISALDLDTHVQNCLESNGYKTVYDVLKASPIELTNIKSFGPLAFENFFSTLEKFFASDSDIFPAKSVQIAADELGDFLINAVLSRDPQLELIITAFEKFSVSLKKQAFLSDFVSAKFNSLPAEILQRKAVIFIRLSDLKDDEFFANLPEDLTFAELPEYLAETSLNFDLDKLEKTAAKLCFDVRALAKKIVALPHRKDRETEILSRRLTGETLNEIGISFGITRERVRQIEDQITERFLIYCFNDLKRIIYFIQAMNEGKKFLTFDDLTEFLDAEDVKVIYFFAEKLDWSNENFYFNKSLNSFIFRDVTDFDFANLSKNLPLTMEESEFVELINKFACEENTSVDLLKFKFLNIYKRTGNFYSRDKLTLSFKCRYILKKYFPNGYKSSNKTFYLQFINHFQETFGKDYLPPQRNAEMIIAFVGVLCDRGKYVHPDFFHVPQEILDRVKNFIDNSPHNAIPYKDIFESLKNIFVGTIIRNRYALQGAIKCYGFPYIMRKDYLTKVDGITVGQEVENFLKERDETSLKELNEQFPSFKKGSDTKAFILSCPEILRIGNGKFLHASRLNLQEEDFEPIKNFLRQNCETTVHSRKLFNLFWKNFVEFMTRNKIDHYEKLFAVLKYMFPDDFYFSRPYISMTNIKDISGKKFLLQFLADAEEIDFDELISLCQKCAVHYVSQGHLSKYMRPEMIRVDKTTLCRPESIGVTDEVVSAVVENIRAAIERNGGWQTAEGFVDYERLPQLKKPWNGFLLESVVALAGNVFHELRNSSIMKKAATVIFVSEDFAQENFRSFIAKVLRVENEKHPFTSKEEIFIWLQRKGLCIDKMPEFLSSGKALQLLTKS